MVEAKHWPDAVNAAVGVCIAASPWILGAQQNRVFMWVALAAGILLVAFAVAAVFHPRAWEEWVQCALGICLIASPWVLGFEDMRNAFGFMVVAGIVVAGLAAWSLLSEEGGGGPREITVR